MRSCQNQIINVADVNGLIRIGVWDTLNVRQQQFDLSAWQEAFGEGQLVVLHQRQGDAIPYEAANVSIADGIATWTFDESDSAVPGYGNVALAYLVGTTYKARTVGFTTFTAKTVGISGATPPDPWEDWFDRVMEASAAAQLAAQNAAASEEAAEGSATDADNSATEAESWAIGGTGTRTGENTDNAKYYAQQAADSAAAASNAQGAAENAQASAEAAQSAAEAAESGAEAAKTAAETAQEAAETAQEAAETAQTGAESAQEAAAGSAAAAASSAAQAAASAASAASAVAGAVKYNEAQTITDVQKQQARENIGAQEELSGTAGKYVGFDTNGDAEAESPDTTPTADSDALITSGGVAAADAALLEKIFAAFPQASVGPADVISIDDGADGIPVKSLSVAIEPVQAGSGEPSPENVRPISGWTGANVFVRGVNLWDEVWEPGSIDSNTGVNIETGTIRSKNYIPVKPGMHICGYSGSTTTVGGCRYYAKDKSYIGQWDANGNTGIFGVERVVPNNCYFIRWNAPAAYPATYQHDISINYPATDTEYHEYNGETYAVAFPTPPGTVYGGTLDVTTGVLEVRPYYASYNGEPLVGPWVSSVDSYADGTTPTIGAQVVDLGGTPQTIQLTATEITTLLGVNNVWANAGQTSMTYRQDISTVLAKLTAALAQ